MIHKTKIKMADIKPLVIEPVFSSLYPKWFSDSLDLIFSLHPDGLLHIQNFIF